MRGTGYTLAVIGVMALATIITRAVPFLFFGRGKPTPRFVLYLGRALPPAIIAMLVVYCLKGVNPTAYPFGLPELIAVAVVVVLQLWRKNSLLSIFGGTAVYMLMVQLVFK
jgi:branched-subunit amino acid transport protein AzlD